MAHKNATILSALQPKGYFTPFIPPNCTDSLQPTDSHVIKCFKDHIKKRYYPLLEATLRSPGSPKNPTREDACPWVKLAWQEVPTSLIVGSFIRCGIESVNDISNAEYLLRLGEATGNIPTPENYLDLISEVEIDAYRTFDAVSWENNSFNTTH